MRALRQAALAGAPKQVATRHADGAGAPEAFWRRRAQDGAASERLSTAVGSRGERHVATASGRLEGPGEAARLAAMWVARGPRAGSRPGAGADP